MNRLTKFAFAALPALSLAVAMPAAAQDEQGPADSIEKVNQLIIYGEDECPKSAGNEIVVCARKPENERFRIPENLRTNDSPSNEAWSQRVESYEYVGDYGTMSCSPSGYGGWSGCTKKLIDAAYSEKKNGSDVRFSELIQAERDKRLATIDQQAAEEQARVEQLEKEYEAKKAGDAGQAGDDSASGGDSGN